MVSWTNRHNQYSPLAQLLPRSRNRCLFLYLLVLIFVSSILLIFFAPCFSCIFRDDIPDSKFPKQRQQVDAIKIEEYDGASLHSVLKDLRHQVAKLGQGGRAVSAVEEVLERPSINIEEIDDEINGRDAEALSLSEPDNSLPAPSSSMPKKVIKEQVKPEQIAENLLDPQVALAINVLQSIIDNPFNTDAVVYEKTAIHFYGMQTRLENTFMKLFFPEGPNKPLQLRIAAVGGSITAANAIPAKSAYYDHFLKWLSTPLKKNGINVTFVNAAIGASGSEYFSMCIHEYFDLTEIDVLFVEFAFNDGRYVFYMSGYQPDAGRPLEELLRSIWRRNPYIHVILINFPFVKNIFRLFYPPKCDSIEDDAYFRVAQHYQVSSLRWKHLFCNRNISIQISREEQASFAEKYIAEDGNHPSQLIHLQMAEFIVHYFRTVLGHMIERLKLGRGATNVGAMVMADKMTVTEQVGRLLSQPIYSTTWINGADCFVSMDRSFRKNRRLRQALANHSPEVGLTDVMGINPLSEDSIDLYILKVSPSFVEFRLDNLKGRLPCLAKTGTGYEARLALTYTLCKDCKPGLLNISTTFEFEDGSLIKSLATIQPKSYGYKTNYVHMLPRFGKGRVMCFNSEQLLKTVTLRIQQATRAYPLLLHAVIVAYSCCSEPALVLHPSLSRQ